ncbi:MAG TPA: ABC transporter substrate-binding protein [Acidimicrobiales bacterium]|jgi:branched-chain amino acid transport system substrate-binding protein
MLNRLKVAAAAAGLAASVLGVGSAASASTKGASAPGVTAKSITLGLVESETGPASSTFGDSATGVKARIDLQNAEGGVHGRKLKLVVADDQSTSTGNLLAVQDLVATKDAFGIMSDNAVLVGGSNYLLKAGVPVTTLGSTITATEPQYTNQFEWSQGQTPSPPTTEIGNLFKKLGVKNVAVLEYSDPQDSANYSVVEKGVQASGLHVCYGSDSLPIGTVNFTSVVLALKQSNCQGVYFPAVESSDVALATAIKQAGVNVKQVYVTGYDQAFLDNTAARAAAQGQYFTATVPLDLPTKPVAQFYAALKKYDPAYKGGVASFGASSGWMIADEMIEGLQLAGANPTRASFIANLAKDKSYTGGGLVPAVDLSDRWKLVGPQCAYFAQLKGSKFVPFPANNKPVCGKVVGAS